MKNVLMAFLFASTALFQAAHAQADVTKADVIANVSQNVVLKTYQDFAARSFELKSSIDTLLSNPTQENLVASQNAWRAARHAYEVSEGFLFGPMDSLSIDPMIDTWPLNLKDLKVILNGSTKIDTDFVRTLNSNVLGFHAIEYLLFGEGITSNTKDVATLTERQTQYLKASSELLVEQVNLLLYAWNTHGNPEDESSLPYITIISTPSATNPQYTTETAVIQEFANGISGIVAEAGKAKLPDATGQTPDEANASLEESPFSWNSINDFTSNINSVLNIYTGTYEGHTGAGLKDLVNQKNPELAARAEAQMLNARDLIGAIRGPNNMSFGQAIKDRQGRERIFTAIHALGDLQKTLENEVTPLLGND